MNGETFHTTLTGLLIVAIRLTSQQQATPQMQLENRKLSTSKVTSNVSYAINKSGR